MLLILLNGAGLRLRLNKKCDFHRFETWHSFWRMNDRTNIKWLKSGLRTEREARKPPSFLCFSCSLDAPKR